MNEIGQIFLCRPDYTKIGAIGGIEESSASLERNISNPSALTFTVYRYSERDGELIENDYYHSLTEWMYLYLHTYDDEEMFFVIDGEPEIESDGNNEQKTITSHSVEVELSTKYLRDFKVNTGIKSSSQEYLVGYYNENGDFINRNLNSYTDLPIDYPVLHNNYARDLAVVLSDLSAMEIHCDVKSGLVEYSQDVYEYLFNIFNKYPRISADVQEDGSMKSYLAVVDNEDAVLGYDVFIGHDHYTDENNQDVPTDEPYTVSYLLNGITGLISYYTEYGHQLSILDLALELGEAAGWSIGNIPDDIAEKKYSFDLETSDVLSFFSTVIPTTCKVIVTFNSVNKTVNIEDLYNEDEERVRDTGVFLSYRNLISNVSCHTSSDDGIRTEFYATGQDNLGITYVNFGRDSVIDLNWFIDKVDSYGNRQFVSEELHDKYHRWIDFCYNESVIVDGKEYSSRREAYKELTRAYNQNILDANEIINQLPNDGVEADYMGYSFDELNLCYKAYMNAMDSVIMMYKTDYGVYTFNLDTTEIWDYNGNKITDPSKNIKNTWYWWDFDAYWHYMIPNVMTALKKYVWTDGTLVLNPKDPRQMDQKTGDWIPYTGGNPWYNSNANLIKNQYITSYKYDMSLYGTKEAELKKEAWLETAGSIFRIGFVIDQNGNVLDYVDPDTEPIYNTTDDPRAPGNAGWDLLSTAQKDNFTTKEAFERALNQYLDYVSTWVRGNSLITPKKNVDNEAAQDLIQSVGVIQLAKNRIAELQPKVDSYLAERDRIDALRDEIGNITRMDNWEEFTDVDLVALHTLLREADYSNENILTTNLDNIVTTIDAEEQLYQDAVTALSENARPQLSFELTTNNLFALDEFEIIRKDIGLLRFIRVSIGLYDDEFMKLRIIGVERNPLIPTEDLTLTFSNMTYSIQGLSDVESIFGEFSGGSGGGSSKGGSGGGEFGDSEIQISNNILNALLRSKQTNYAIGQVLVDQVLSESGYAELMAKTGIFDSFYAGDVKISGDCLVDYIRSSNYDGGKIYVDTSTEGSYINLKNGWYSFAGSNNVFDGHKLDIGKGGFVYNIDRRELNIGKGGIVYDVNQNNLQIRADSISISGTDVATQDDIDELDDEVDAAAAAASAAGKAASDAKNAADNAAKVATSYIHYDSSNGLILSQKASSYNSGYNTQIASNKINFRYNTTILSSFSGSGVELYENGIKVANFGSTVTLGIENSSGFYAKIDSNGFRLYKGSSMFGLMKNVTHTSSGQQGLGIVTTGKYLSLGCDPDESTSSYTSTIYINNGGSLHGHTEDLIINGTSVFDKTCTMEKLLTCNSAVICNSWIEAESYGRSGQSEEVCITTSGNFVPLDSNMYCGTSSHYWKKGIAKDGWGDTSDRKMKNHICFSQNDKNNIFEFLMSLKPAEYSFKDDSFKKLGFGFYAQDVYKSWNVYFEDSEPQLIDYSLKEEYKNEEITDIVKDDYKINWSLQYTQLISPMLLMLQEHHKEIEQLKQEIGEIRILIKNKEE